MYTEIVIWSKLLFVNLLSSCPFLWYLNFSLYNSAQPNNFFCSSKHLPWNYWYGLFPLFVCLVAPCHWLWILKILPALVMVQGAQTQQRLLGVLLLKMFQIRHVECLDSFGIHVGWGVLKKGSLIPGSKHSTSLFQMLFPSFKSFWKP